MKNLPNLSARRRAGGAVLPITMILLLVITLVALAALRGTILQERMAAGQRDRSLEFQTAEAALRAAETVIRNDTTNALGQNCVTAAVGCGLPDDAGVVAGCANCWVNAPAAMDPGAAGAPQYLIQRFDSLSTAAAYGLANSAGTANYGGGTTSFTARAYYRVFARSRDPGGDAQGRAFVLLSANFAVPTTE